MTEPAMTDAEPDRPALARAAGIAIEVIERDPEWRAAFPACEGLCRSAALAACGQLAADGAAGEVAVVLADDAFVRGLNRTYRGKDAATNVLAFANDDDGPLPPGEPRQYGDVILARETLLREAAKQDKAPEDHLRHLVVHGVLHLLGCDHRTDREAAEMEAHEVAALAGLGVPDPYAADPHGIGEGEP